MQVLKYSERIFYEGILYLESSLYIGKKNSESIFQIGMLYLVKDAMIS